MIEICGDVQLGALQARKSHPVVKKMEEIGGKSKASYNKKWKTCISKAMTLKISSLIYMLNIWIALSANKFWEAYSYAL